MMRAVLFDLNGIFVRSRKLSDRFAEQFGVPPDTFLPALQNIMDIVRRPGAGDAFSYWQPYLRAWDVPLDRGQFFSFWFSAETIVPAMLRVAEALRARNTAVLIVSNNFRERSQYYAEHFPELLQAVDGITYSWQTGSVKPNPRAFAAAVQTFSLAPKACVCVDDADANVRAAASLGMHAIRFTTVSACRAQLTALGLLNGDPRP